MNEKIIIIDFGTPIDILNDISWSIRRLGCFTQIIPSNIPINFTSDIIGIILIGIDNYNPSYNFNLNNINIPILGILNGSIIMAQSHNCKIGQKHNINESIQNWISHKETLNQFLMGCQKCHYINMTEHYIINGTNINILTFNQKCGQTIFQIKNKSQYGVQFIPIVESLIWRNFLVICNYHSLWTIELIINKLNQNLLEYLNKKKFVYLFYENNLKSMILINLLIKNNVSLDCIILDHGIHKMEEIDTWTNNIQSLGLNISILELKKEMLEIMFDNINNNEKTNRIESLLINKIKEIYGDKVLLLNNESELFFELLSPELKQLAEYLNISNKIYYKQQLNIYGLIDRFEDCKFTMAKFTLIQKLDYLWTSFLKTNYYFEQYYQSGISFISENTISIWAKDLNDNPEIIPSYIITKILPKLKEELIIYPKIRLVLQL